VVRVQVRVGADGRVLAVALAEGCGHRILDEAALEAVRSWRFQPGRDAAGAPVPAVVVVPVRFQILDEAER